MNEFSRKPAHTEAELASARQHQEKENNWPTIMYDDDELHFWTTARPFFFVRLLTAVLYTPASRTLVSP